MRPPAAISSTMRTHRPATQRTRCMLRLTGLTMVSPDRAPRGVFPRVIRPPAVSPHVARRPNTIRAPVTTSLRLLTLAVPLPLATHLAALRNRSPRAAPIRSARARPRRKARPASDTASRAAVLIITQMCARVRIQMAAGTAAALNTGFETALKKRGLLRILRRAHRRSVPTPRERFLRRVRRPRPPFLHQVYQHSVPRNS